MLAGFVPAQRAAAQTVALAPQDTHQQPSIFLPILGDIGATPQLSYDVTYKPSATVIDDQTMTAHLLAGDETSLEYRFRSGAAAVAQLKPGDVVIFSGLALRKVVNVSTASGQIVVQTEEASLDQAIRDGTVAWRYPVKWLALPASAYTAAAGAGSGLQVAAIQGFDAAGQPVANAALPPEISFKGTIEGWEVTLKLKPTAARLEIDLTGKRVAGVAQASVTAKGWISTFTQESVITYEEGALDRVAVKSTGLTGEMELRWAALAPDGSALTSIVQFQLPLEIPIPLRVGPIPVKLKIKASLQVVPELRVYQASSGGSWKVTYRSDQGFEWQDGAANASGGLHNANVDRSADLGSAGYGPVGFGLGVEYPRVEVSVFDVATAFITLKSYGSSIFLLEPPCQMGSLLIFAAAGFSFKVLNLSLGSGQTELWRHEQPWYKDDKPCG
jgi:hypothetical protein